jgi:hypothetical protein
VALRFFVGQKIILSIFNMDSKKRRIFCATKILKGQSTELKNESFGTPHKSWSDKLQCLPNANPNAKK